MKTPCYFTTCYFKTYTGLVLAAALVQGPWARAATGDEVRGAALYKAQCAACHSADYNGVGPLHRGVVGRKSGAVPGYGYSTALKKADLTWDDATLLSWLTDPEKMLPGQKMYVGVEHASDRADLVAYLRTLTTKK